MRRGHNLLKMTLGDKTGFAVVVILLTLLTSAVVISSRFDDRKKTAAHPSEAPAENSVTAVQNAIKPLDFMFGNWAGEFEMDSFKGSEVTQINADLDNTLVDYKTTVEVPMTGIVHQARIMVTVDSETNKLVAYYSSPGEHYKFKVTAYQNEMVLEQETGLNSQYIRKFRFTKTNVDSLRVQCLRKRNGDKFSSYDVMFESKLTKQAGNVVAGELDYYTD